MYKRYLAIFIFFLIIVSAIYFPILIAENIAVRYMEINKIYNDESYKAVKSRIYDISSDYVKDTFFRYDNYPLDNRYPISYEIHSISSDLIGFNNYIVYVDYTVNECMRLTSAFEVEDGIVRDSYRID